MPRAMQPPRGCHDSVMKKMKSALPFVAVLMLAACAAPSATNSPEQTAPQVDPGPVELTIEEAGERYLAIVCQTNFANESLSAAFVAGEQEFLNGGEPSVDAIRSAGAEVVRTSRLQIEMFDDDYYIWPEEVAEQLPHLRAASMAELSALQAVANAERFQDAYYMQYPERSAEQQAAPQEIRYQLGLSADTTESCVGFETALDDLKEEMTKRQEALDPEAKSDE